MYCAIPRSLWFEFIFSELSDKGAWVALNYVNRFSEFKQFDENVERINVNDVSCQEFIDRFEKLYKPVVIEGMQVSQSIHFFFTEFQNTLNPNVDYVILGRMEGKSKMDRRTISKKISKSKV